MWTLAGDAANPAFSAELMLRDALDCTTRARIEDIASLPVERTVPIPLAWFARSSKGRDAGGEACTLDLSQVEALKLALSDAEGADEVTFFVDTLRVATADELRVADPGRFACPPADREDLQGQIAADLRAQVSAAQAAYGHALIPAWAEEPDPHYYIYSEALAIIALAGEHRRTGNPAMAEAAQALATDLTALEPESTGIWADLYLNADDPSPSDTGDTWPGNPAWVVIALDRLLEWAPPEDPSAIEGALQRGADWLLAQIATSEENPAITNGVEGNLSTWFALRAAERHFPDGGYGAAADGIDAWIDSRGRSEGLGLVWMGGGSPWLATDTAGSWGVDYLRARGLHEEALLSQRLGAGTMAVWDWERGAWGLGDIAGPWQPSWEFTAEYVAAGGLGGEELMTQIAAQMVDGRLAGSPEDFSGGGTWNTSWTGVSPAAWAWLALDGGFLHRL
jgi:hypothetical protein